MEGDALSWAAGLLDGEAYFATSGDISCEIKVDMVHPHPLADLQTLFGGSLKRFQGKGRKRAYWRWRICGDAARGAASKLLPLLRSKRMEAEAVALSKLYPASTALGAGLRERAWKHRWSEYGEE